MPETRTDLLAFAERPDLAMRVVVRKLLRVHQLLHQQLKDTGPGKPANNETVTALSALVDMLELQFGTRSAV